MSEEQEPRPEGSTLLQAEKVDASELQTMERRLAELEARLEADGLGWESEYRKKLLREVDQRMQFREISFVVAAFVLIGLAFFAWAGFNVIASHTGSVEAATGAFKIGLFVTPVVAISAITVMLVIGAFRKPKDDDEVSLPNLLTEVVRNLRS
jgi:hypothetical protein